ncbi:MAG: DUF4276 family protein [Verrucomicrobiota bacterium]|jgi:hypothetical protein
MEIAIYFEGGGDSAENKAKLRHGISAFLKPLVDLARQRRSRWSITSCGGRGQAWDAFSDALEKEPEKFNVLLVDSEEAVTASPRAHLQQRDGWNLQGAQEEQVHLMAQCMETWLVADPDALADYYGQGFNRNALPRRINLEDEPKSQIHAALESATRQTQKGSYGKVKHAGKLLTLVSPEKAKPRCHHCDRLFSVLAAKIQS